MLINIAREKGISAYISEGLNVWPAVHRFDAARLYRLAVEKNARRAIYHGVAEEGIPFKDIATTIGRHLNVPVQSQTPEEAAGHFGWFTHFAGINNRASSQQTRTILGWEPKEAGLLIDMEQANYF